MSSRAERTQETKQTLLVAARELIVEQGWSSVSNRAICERAGVNLALINSHFGSKRGLLAAMLDRAAEEIAASVTRSLGDLRKRIERMLGAQVPKAATYGLVTLLAALLDGILLHSLLDPNSASAANVGPLETDGGSQSAQMPSGCGCSASAQSSMLAFILPALPALGVRRRRMAA